MSSRALLFRAVLGLLLSTAMWFLAYTGLSVRPGGMEMYTATATILGVVLGWSAAVAQEERRRRGNVCPLLWAAALARGVPRVRVIREHPVRFLRDLAMVANAKYVPGTATLLFLRVLPYLVGAGAGLLAWWLLP